MILFTLASSMSRNRQPTTVWPGAAGRPHRCHPHLAADRVGEEAAVEQQPVTDPQHTGGCERDAGAGKILERAVDAVAIDHVLAVDRLQPRHSADRDALSGAAAVVHAHGGRVQP